MTSRLSRVDLGIDADLRRGCLGLDSGCLLAGLGVFGLDLALQRSLGLVMSIGVVGPEECLEFGLDL